MKYAVLLGDGMADDPQPEKGHLTPLELAHTPHMDRMAMTGTMGMVRTVPQGMEPGSDVANMSILGYDPHKYYTGRAAIEAAAMGISLQPEQVALRCNLVSTSDGPHGKVMEDYSAGHITTEESKKIIGTLQKELGSEKIRFFSGVGFRNLLIINEGQKDVTLFPPHDYLGRPLAEIQPRGKGAADIIKLHQDSQKIMKDHPVNKQRQAQGKKTADSIWLWGLGTAPSFQGFKDRFGLDGAVITGVDLIRGLGRLLGFKVIDIPGATGYVDTNYQGKAKGALQALKDIDFLFLHVEAPDEAAHEGNLDLKIKAIQDFDTKIVGPILQGMDDFDDWRIMVLPDHETPLKQRNHRGNPVPFVIVGKKEWRMHRQTDKKFSEKQGARSKIMSDPGHELLRSYLFY